MIEAIIVAIIGIVFVVYQIFMGTPPDTERDYARWIKSPGAALFVRAKFAGQVADKLHALAAQGYLYAEIVVAQNEPVDADIERLDEITPVPYGLICPRRAGQSPRIIGHLESYKFGTDYVQKGALRLRLISGCARSERVSTAQPFLIKCAMPDFIKTYGLHDAHRGILYSIIYSSANSALRDVLINKWLTQFSTLYYNDTHYYTDIEATEGYPITNMDHMRMLADTVAKIAGVFSASVVPDRLAWALEIYKKMPSLRRLSRRWSRAEWTSEHFQFVYMRYELLSAYHKLRPIFAEYAAVRRILFICSAPCMGAYIFHILCPSAKIEWYDIERKWKRYSMSHTYIDSSESISHKGKSKYELVIFTSVCGAYMSLSQMAQIIKESASAALCLEDTIDESFFAPSESVGLRHDRLAPGAVKLTVSKTGT
mgnify:CR=1 FL=1